MTVLVVTQHYAPDETSTAEYLTTIAEEIAADHEVIVLSGTPGSAAYAASHAGPPVIEVRNRITPKQALFRRMIAMIAFGIRMFAAVLRRVRRRDVVLVVTTPFALPYFVILAARLRGASCVLLLYDLYPEVLVASGLLNERSIIVAALRLLNHLLFRLTTVVVALGRDMQAHLLRDRQLPPAKIAYIPNWATLPVGLRPLVADNYFRRGLGGRFVVGLFGTLGFTHDPATVFEAARTLAPDPDIHFLLSGSGVGWQRLTAMQAQRGLPNVTLVVERIPNEQLEEFLAAADIWIIPHRKNMRGLSVPSRFYNLLAVGRGVIALSEPDAEHAQVLLQNEIGWVVAPEQPALLAEQIRSIARDPEAVAVKGRRAAAVVAPQFTREVRAQKYRNLVSRLAQRQ